MTGQPLGAPPVWTPGSAPGLMGWVCGEHVSGLADNTTLTRMGLSSPGGGYFVTGGTGTAIAYRTNFVNGKSVLSFGNGIYLSSPVSPALAASKPITVAAVYNPTNLTVFHEILRSVANGGINFRINQTTGMAELGTRAINTIATASVAVTAAAFNIVIVTLNVNGDYKFRINKVDGGSGNSANEMNAGSFSPEVGGGCLGSLAELAWWSYGFTSADFAAAEDYFARRYAI